MSPSDGEDAGDEGGAEAGLGGVAARPRLRWVAAGLVGLSFFSLGTIYLSLDRMPDVVTLVLLGGEKLEAGSTAVVRVDGRMADSNKRVPVEVNRVTLDGQPAKIAVVGSGSPVDVHLTVPEGAGEKAKLAVSVSAAERVEALEVELPVTRHGSGLVGLAPPSSLPEIKTSHRVELLPEAGVLIGGMDNRVFVRVRAPSGVPVEGARVVVKHPTFTGGQRELRTDSSGLTDFFLSAKRPSYRLGIEVSSEAEGTTRMEELLRPLGRRMRLDVEPVVTRPGEIPGLTLTTWRPEDRIYCELRRGPAVLWSSYVSVPQRTLALKTPPLSAGAYDMVCYDHPHVPGDTYASVPVLVAEGDPLEVLLAEARSRGRWHESALTAPEGTRPQRAQRYWIAALREPPVALQLLAATRGEDLKARQEERDTFKTWVLGGIGVLFLLLLLWIGDLVLKQIVDQRDRLRAFAIENADEDGPDDEIELLMGLSHKGREGLQRTRGMLILIVVGGTLILNVIAFVWLLAIIR